jgi:hypothetical protein
MPENAALKNRLDSLKNKGAYPELNQAYSELAVKLEAEYQKLDLFHYSQAQVKTYTTLGGTPHLDQKYTVFGEVVEGLAVIDSIAQVKTNQNNRPLSNVVMKMRVVKKKP